MTLILNQKIIQSMKSNISQNEIKSGKKIINILQKHNPLLSPHLLKKIIPEYKKFSPHINQYGFWFSPNIKKINSSKYDKIVFLMNGLAASGKDSIYNEMTKLEPSLFFKTVTATSRLPRENEADGIDYFFYTNISSFKKDINNNQFLEYIKRGNSYYGLPKKSIHHALIQPKPIIYCQIEMSGWPKIEKYLFSLNQDIILIKAFILPYMKISQYLKWLVKNRGNEEIESRISKSGWELKIAPQKTDLIISNRIENNIPTLTYTAKTTINLLSSFLKNYHIKKYSTPTDNLKFTRNIIKIVKTHNSIL